MKKFALIILSVMLMAIMISGCTKKEANAYDGAYKLKSFMGMDIEALQSFMGEDGDASKMFHLTINGDKGTFETEDEKQEVEIKIDDGEIIMNAEGESMEGTIKDGVITFDMEGVDLVLEKEK